MSDGESTTPGPRRRPSYGLPGPTSPAPGSTPPPTAPSYGVPHGTSSYGAPGHDPSAAAASGAHGGFGHDPYAPQTGPLPPMGPSGAPRRRRRGLWPLIIGLVLLLVISPVVTIGGFLWSAGSLAGDASSGPVVMEGSSADVDVAANEMLIVYVPLEDAAGAECSAEGSAPGAVSVVPSSSSITFGDGSEYEQKIGVAVLEDTTVTISCTGTEAPAYLGPYSLFGMAAPLLIGAIVGVVAGLVGLVLTIVGIVLLVRSRRS
jgi:hypothetical protein